MTIPEPQEWLKSATGGETDSPTVEVDIGVDEVTCHLSDSSQTEKLDQ